MDRQVNIELYDDAELKLPENVILQLFHQVFFFMVCLDLVHLKDLNSSLVCFSKVLQDPFLGPINIIEVGPGEVSTFGAGHVAWQVTNGSMCSVNQGTLAQGCSSFVSSKDTKQKIQLAVERKGLNRYRFEGKKADVIASKKPSTNNVECIK